MNVGIFLADTELGYGIASRLTRDESLSPQINRVYCFVTNKTTSTSVELMTLDKTNVYEVDLPVDQESLKQQFQEQEVSALILLPNWSVPSMDAWYHQVNECLKAAVTLRKPNSLSGTGIDSSSAPMTKVILFSLLGVDEETTPPKIPIFSQWKKLESEFVEMGKGLAWTIFRIPLLQELLLLLQRMARETGTFQIGIGKGRVPFLSIHDVANCVGKELLLFTDMQPRVYRLTGSESIGGEELVETFNKAVQQRFKFKDMDPTLFIRYLDLEFQNQQTMLPTPEVTQLLQAVKVGAFDIVTSVVEELSGENPQKLSHFFKVFADLFCP